MSYQAVISHIEKILNKCGDSVQLVMTGNHTTHESGQMSIEIEKVLIKKQNTCCEVAPPIPSCTNNPKDKYWINRIRISPDLADDYSKGFPLTDNEIRDLICKKEFLFGCFI